MLTVLPDVIQIIYVRETSNTSKQAPNPEKQSNPTAVTVDQSPPVVLDVAITAVHYWSFFASCGESLQKMITNEV